MKNNLLNLVSNKKALTFLFFSYFCNSTFAGLFTINDSIEIGSLSLSESFVSYYSYGSPDNSSANTGYEEEGNAIMLLAEYNNELALFTLIDSPGGSHGTRSGEMILSDFNSSDVIFVDDSGEDTGTGFEWLWASCCTDGMIYKISNNDDFDIDINFVDVVGLNDIKFLSFASDGTLLEENIVSESFSIQNKVSVPEPSIFSLFLYAVLGFVSISYSAKRVS